MSQLSFGLGRGEKTAAPVTLITVIYDAQNGVNHMEIIDYQVEQVIRRELGADEKLLWSGSPLKGLLFRKFDIVMIPFSLLWTGFAVTWEIVAIRTKAPSLLVLWGIPFVLFGLQITFGRFIIDAKIRSSTIYGVTNKRIIIISGLMNRKIQSSDLKSLRGLALSVSTNNRGTISFGAVNPQSSWMQNLPFGQAAEPMFEMIENPRKVFEIIQKTKET